MRGFSELKREFPDAETIARIQLRRASGWKIDIDGPYDDLESDLLMHVASLGPRKHGKKEQEAMKACLAVLAPGLEKKMAGG